MDVGEDVAIVDDAEGLGGDEADEEECLFQELMRDEGDDGMGELDAEDRRLLRPSVDPVLWRAEVERVSSRLAAHRAGLDRRVLGWADRLKTAHGALDTYSSLGFIPSFKSKSTPSACSPLQASPPTVASLETGERSPGGGGPLANSLRLFADSHKRSLGRLEAAESRLTTAGSIAALADERARLRAEMDALSARSAEQRCSLAALARTLEEINEKWSEVCNAAEAHASQATDVDKVSSIRRAVQVLRADSRDMDLKLGVVAQQLVLFQIRERRERRTRSGASSGSRHRGHT